MTSYPYVPFRSVQTLISSFFFVDSGKYETLAKVLRPELDETQIEDVYQALDNLPVVTLELSLRFSDGRSADIPITSDQKRQVWHRVGIDDEYTLCINLKRRNRLGKDGKVHAPK